MVRSAFCRSWISIHALREEGDARLGNLALAGDISIHALREEGDLDDAYSVGEVQKFLSTPSARRATLACLLSPPLKAYFYPRPPRGGRRHHGGHQEGPRVFLSTPSARRATSVGFTEAYGEMISIHALREEGDQHCCGS